MGGISIVTAIVIILALIAAFTDNVMFAVVILMVYGAWVAYDYTVNAPKNAIKGLVPFNNVKITKDDKEKKKNKK